MKVRRARSSCCSITARTWSRSAPAPRTGCAGCGTTAGPSSSFPNGCLDRQLWLERLAGRLARSAQNADVRVTRHQVRRLKALTREVNTIERELLLVRGLQPQLLDLPGVGALTAAKLIAEIAGIERFRSHAKLARMAGIAPVPASSGNRTRVRLDRGGNRQLNAAVHRVAVTQLRCHQPAKDYVAPRIRRRQNQTRSAALPKAPPRPHHPQHHDPKG